MKIIYFSLTGNSERFAKKLDENAISIDECGKLTENSVLVFPTIGFGKVPRPVIRFLKENREYIKLVVASGNKNWGQNFAVGGETITEKLGIPHHKIELAGTPKDVENVLILIHSIERIEALEENSQRNQEKKSVRFENVCKKRLSWVSFCKRFQNTDLFSGFVCVNTNTPVL